jgi:hypothetical protein
MKRREPDICIGNKIISKNTNSLWQGRHWTKKKIVIQADNYNP